MKTRIKICGITRMEDASAAVLSGVDALGFIFWKPSPRFIDPVAAARIVGALPPFVASVAVFVNPAREEVLHAIAAAGPSVLQFHGEESPDFCSSFGRPYIKVFKVGQRSNLLESAASYGDAAGWLFDAYDEKRVGGTGETFDWDLIPHNLTRPLVLSGGLEPDNVAAAIRKVRPYAVDVSSGVESAKGIKDAAKIAAFVQGVLNADQ